MCIAGATVLFETTADDRRLPGRRRVLAPTPPTCRVGHTVAWLGHTIAFCGLLRRDFDPRNFVKNPVARCTGLKNKVRLPGASAPGLSRLTRRIKSWLSPTVSEALSSTMPCGLRGAKPSPRDLPPACHRMYGCRLRQAPGPYGLNRRFECPSQVAFADAAPPATPDIVSLISAVIFSSVRDQSSPGRLEQIRLFRGYRKRYPDLSSQR